MIMLVLRDLRWIFITKHLKICLLQRENLTIESEKKTRVKKSKNIILKFALCGGSPAQFFLHKCKFEAPSIHQNVLNPKLSLKKRWVLFTHIYPNQCKKILLKKVLESKNGINKCCWQWSPTNGPKILYQDRPRLLICKVFTHES